VPAGASDFIYGKSTSRAIPEIIMTTPRICEIVREPISYGLSSLIRSSRNRVKPYRISMSAVIEPGRVSFLGALSESALLKLLRQNKYRIKHKSRALADE